MNVMFQLGLASNGWNGVAVGAVTTEDDEEFFRDGMRVLSAIQRARFASFLVFGGRHDYYLGHVMPEMGAPQS